MLIKTDIDIAGALSTLDLILKKVPYATNNALTRTAKELVDVEREELKTEFQVRKQFILNRVRIVKYSRPNDLWTRVAIDRNVQGGDLLLTMFEDGGEKLPQLGTELAVPITGSPARPSFPQKVTPRLLYKALHMQKHITANGKVQYKGDQRTFVIPGIGIFQRVATKGKARKHTHFSQFLGQQVHDTSSTVLLYKFRSGVPLRGQMHFVKTAREFVRRRFGELWAEEFARVMAGRRR
jgi:hypothetical protein